MGPLEIEWTKKKNTTKTEEDRLSDSFLNPDLRFVNDKDGL